MKRVRDWLQRMLSEGDGSPSTKRVVFVVAAAIALALCVADFVKFRALTNNCVQLATIVITTSGAAYTAGRFAENKDQ